MAFSLPHPESVSRPGLGLALCLAAGLACGLLVARVELLWAGLILGGVLGATLLFTRPFLGLVALVGSTCFISFYSKLPGCPVKSIHLPDILFIMLAGVFILGLLTGRFQFHLTALGRVFVFFLSLAFVSLIIGVVFGGIKFFESFREFKVILYYGLFLLVCGFCTEEKTLRLLTMGCLIVGFITSIIVVVNGLINLPAVNASAEDIYYSNTALQGGGGGVLVFWCLCCSIALLVLDRVRPVTLAGFSMYLLFFILKFHRHMYMTIALALLLIVFFAFDRFRKIMVPMLVLTGVVIIFVGTLLAWGPPALSRYADLSLKRMESIQTIKSTRTVSTRLMENHYSIIKILQNPLFGIGFARPYRPSIYGPEDGLHAFVHNGYLSIALKTGLLGLLAFLSMSVLFVRRGLASWKRVDDPFFKAVILGSTVSFLGMLFANMTSPYFIGDWGVASFGIMFAFTEGVLTKERGAS